MSPHVKFHKGSRRFSGGLGPKRHGLESLVLYCSVVNGPPQWQLKTWDNWSSISYLIDGILFCSGERSYTVVPAENGFHCDCSTFTTTHLLCLHIFRVMDVLKLAFQADSIPQRWSKAHTKLTAAQPVQPEQFSVTRVERKTKMTRTEKFKELSRVLRDISMCCDLFGHCDFCQRYDVIVNLHKAWQIGRTVMLAVEQGCPPPEMVDSQLGCPAAEITTSLPVKWKLPTKPLARGRPKGEKRNAIGTKKKRVKRKETVLGYVSETPKAKRARNTPVITKDCFDKLMGQLSRYPLPRITSALDMGQGRYQNHTALSLFYSKMTHYESGLNEVLDEILELANKKSTQWANLLHSNQLYCDKFHMASTIILRSRQLSILALDMLCTLDPLPFMDHMTLDMISVSLPRQENSWAIDVFTMTTDSLKTLLPEQNLDHQVRIHHCCVNPTLFSIVS